MFAAQTVPFISAPLILSLSGRSTGIICLFTPITLYSVFPLLARADEVPEAQYPHGLITKQQIAETPIAQHSLQEH